MKPFTTYYGGKQRIAKWIVEKIPPHSVYAEPFFGGGAVFFAKGGNPRDSYVEVINDRNSYVVNFYRCLQDAETRERLLDKIEFSLHSRDFINAAKEVRKRGESADPVDRAFSFFLEINQAFSAKLDGGFGRSLTSSRAKRYKGKVARVLENFDRFRDVTIENVDALDLIERWDSSATFFYCDPPYVSTNQGHYKGYTQGDFDRLVDVLRGIKGSFLLSCYDDSLEFEKFEKRTVMVARPDQGVREPRREILYRKCAR